MGFILITTIIGAVVGFIVESEDICSDIFSKFFASVLIGLVGFLIGMIIECFIIYPLLDITVGTESYVYKTKEITALKDNSSDNLMLFLGTGKSEEELKYYAIIKGDNGIKQIEDFDIDDVYIKETNENYRLEELHYRYKNDILNLLFITIKEKYVFYVPKNSVCNSYSIDLE